MNKLNFFLKWVRIPAQDCVWLTSQAWILTIPFALTGPWAQERVKGKAETRVSARTLTPSWGHIRLQDTPGWGLWPPGLYHQKAIWSQSNLLASREHPTASCSANILTTKCPGSAPSFAAQGRCLSSSCLSLRAWRQRRNYQGNCSLNQRNCPHGRYSSNSLKARLTACLS